MTPAINTAIKARITYTVHEYDHDPSETSYGLEAANKLNIAAGRVFKTLVVNIGAKELAVAIVPVSSMLNMKRVAKVMGVKKVNMAEVPDVERSTGYVLGGVSPLGQKKKLKTVIDSSALEYATVFISAGRRGLEIELTPHDLQSLTRASLANISD